MDISTIISQDAASITSITCCHLQPGFSYLLCSNELSFLLIVLLNITSLLNVLDKTSTMPKEAIPKQVLYRSWISGDSDFNVEGDRLFCNVCVKSVSIIFQFVFL